MRILHEEYAHPTQATTVGLSVFESRDGGYLVTEERRGTATVYRTLGVFDTREAATARVRERSRELGAQRYRRAGAAA
jgi:hypothetical protein